LASFLAAVPNATIVSSNLINYHNDTYLSNFTIEPYAIHTFAGGERVRPLPPPPNSSFPSLLFSIFFPLSEF
jgi:hypothetical protein